MSDLTIETQGSNDLTTELVATVVAAFVSNNTVAIADLPALIQSISQSFGGIGTVATAPAPSEPLVPFTSVKKSVTPEYLISLEDGRRFKSLKRHLRTAYNMSPDQYRAKWGLSKDYPMVAPNYAKARSDLAKSMGLGTGGPGRPPLKATAAKADGRKTRQPKVTPVETQQTAEA